MPKSDPDEVAGAANPVSLVGVGCPDKIGRDRLNARDPSGQIAWAKRIDMAGLIWRD